MSWLDRIPFITLVMISLLLGLAPFVPEPHVWEKLKMLFDGSLSKPVDMFDLCMHGTPWVLLGLKTIRHFTFKENQQQND